MSGEYSNYTREGLEQMAQSQATRIADLEAERDAFRAVLEGAEYGDLEGIAKQGPDMNRMLGMEVKRLTVNQINRAKTARNDALREAADWCAKNTMEIPMRQADRKYAGMFAAGDCYENSGTHHGMGYADAIRAMIEAAA